ncbi:hypothetical protein HYE11_03850 [Mycoplasmopsis bovis]|nr:hypothetical protein HYE11_03850 [Mycoplasmopsis bovis]
MAANDDPLAGSSVVLSVSDFSLLSIICMSLDQILFLSFSNLFLSLSFFISLPGCLSAGLSASGFFSFFKS